MSESDRRGGNIFGEIRRMARTSGAVGGIAARVAGERYLGIKTDKHAHAEDLKAVLGNLKGPLMKVAQILSTVPDVLPAEPQPGVDVERDAHRHDRRGARRVHDVEVRWVVHHQRDRGRRRG